MRTNLPPWKRFQSQTLPPWNKRRWTQFNRTQLVTNRICSSLVSHKKQCKRNKKTNPKMTSTFLWNRTMLMSHPLTWRTSWTRPSTSTQIQLRPVLNPLSRIWWQTPNKNELFWNNVKYRIFCDTLESYNLLKGLFYYGYCTTSPTIRSWRSFWT